MFDPLEEVDECVITVGRALRRLAYSNINMKMPLRISRKTYSEQNTDASV